MALLVESGCLQSQRTEVRISPTANLSNWSDNWIEYKKLFKKILERSSICCQGFSYNGSILIIVTLSRTCKVKPLKLFSSAVLDKSWQRFCFSPSCPWHVSHYNQDIFPSLLGAWTVIRIEPIWYKAGHSNPVWGKVQASTGKTSLKLLCVNELGQDKKQEQLN